MSILSLHRRHRPPETMASAAGEDPYPGDAGQSITDALAALAALAEAPPDGLHPSFTPADPAPTTPIPELAGTPAPCRTDAETLHDALTALRNWNAAPARGSEPVYQAVAAEYAPEPAPSRVKRIRADKAELPFFRSVIRQQGLRGLLPVPVAPPLPRRDSRWRDALNAIAVAFDAAQNEIALRTVVFDAEERQFQESPDEDGDPTTIEYAALTAEWKRVITERRSA